MWNFTLKSWFSLMLKRRQMENTQIKAKISLLALIIRLNCTLRVVDLQKKI